MLKFKYSSIALLSLSCLGWNSGYANTLQVMTDEQLSDVVGQALMSLTYLAPSDQANLESKRVNGSNNIGFYKLGLEAELELNANIRKLQLGCGQMNGKDGCDIDIDNFSISGLFSSREGRASSDAILSNPFIEFAIRNPNSASTREIVGLRLSAEKAFGMLTFGQENSETANGINSFSGYMKLASATGIATTAKREMTNALGNMTGRISVQNAFPLSSSPRGFSSNNYNLTLNAASVPFATKPMEINGSRMSSVNLVAEALIPEIDFSGPLAATINVVGFIPITLNKNVTGKITNLGVDIGIKQSLGMIHSIPVNGNPFSLSLQRQDLQWSNAAVAAGKGWWMAFENDIQLGDVTPNADIPITNQLLAQVLPKVNQYLYNNPINCNGYSGCLGGELPIYNPINLSGQRVSLPLENLVLGAQSFEPNCYGSLKFC